MAAEEKIKPTLGLGAQAAGLYIHNVAGLETEYCTTVERIDVTRQDKETKISFASAILFAICIDYGDSLRILHC